VEFKANSTFFLEHLKGYSENTSFEPPHRVPSYLPTTATRYTRTGWILFRFFSANTSLRLAELAVRMPDVRWDASWSGWPWCWLVQCTLARWPSSVGRCAAVPSKPGRAEQRAAKSKQAEAVSFLYTFLFMRPSNRALLVDFIVLISFFSKKDNGPKSSLRGQ
jgi:hypothetical protein